MISKFFIFLLISFAFYFTYREGIYAPFANTFTQFMNYKYSLPEPSYMFSLICGAVITMIVSD